MGLYDRFLELQKVAQEEQQVSEVEESRVQVILQKTAEAQELLKQANVTEYTEDDLADVVTALIQKEVEDEASAEKVAELYDMGKIMSQGIYDGLNELINKK
jgi:molybdopterin-biosynthesis enzyme MoeA-like protein